MVVGLALAAVQMGMALPTGFLFGVGYGTGVRIGYEQVYPLLFPKGARPTTTELAATMKGMNTVYDAIGGKDASRMGIAVGITNAGEILNNPDFRVLEQLESSSSGPTSSNLNRSRYGADNTSPPQDSSSDVTGLNTTYFNSYYNSIRSFTLSRTITEYGLATQYKNGLSKQQNDDFIIPALRTRLAQLRSSSESTTPNTTAATLPPAPTRTPTSSEQEFINWNANYWRLHQEVIKKRDAARKNRSAINTTYWRNALSQLKTLSNDYRNPNNTIRNAVLKLRQALAQGFYNI